MMIKQLSLWSNPACHDSLSTKTDFGSNSNQRKILSGKDIPLGTNLQWDKALLVWSWIIFDIMHAVMEQFNMLDNVCCFWQIQKLIMIGIICQYSKVVLWIFNYDNTLIIKIWENWLDTHIISATWLMIMTGCCHILLVNILIWAVLIMEKSRA